MKRSAFLTHILPTKKKREKIKIKKRKADIYTGEIVPASQNTCARGGVKFLTNYTPVR